VADRATYSGRDAIEADFRKELRVAELCMEDVRRRFSGEFNPTLLTVNVRSLVGATARLAELANELKGFSDGAAKGADQ
jgi:hypothetical protein